MTESILDATQEQLKSGQAKITYLGTQSKPIATVIFHTEGHKVLLERFTEVQRSGKPYTNDELPYTSQFSVTPSEFARMLSAVKSLLIKTNTDPPPSAFISFTVACEAQGSVEGQEFHISSEVGQEFYKKLIGALNPENKVGRSALTKQFSNIYPPQ